MPATASPPAGTSRGLIRFVVLELALWTSLYGLYLAVRGFSISSTDEALANARSVIDAERALGLFEEAPMQDAFGALQGITSVYYLLGFAPLVVGVLVWLGIREPDLYRRLRSLLLLSIALATIIHIVIPVAPPRLVPELGIADTVGLDHSGSTFAGIRFNPYAAMPSMHVGWSLLVGLFAFRAAGSTLARVFFAAHPAVMALAVTVTGNHFFLDSLAGVAVALAALGLSRLVPVAHGFMARQSLGSSSSFPEVFRPARSSCACRACSSG